MHASILGHLSEHHLIGFLHLLGLGHGRRLIPRLNFPTATIQKYSRAKKQKGSGQAKHSVPNTQRRVLETKVSRYINIVRLELVLFNVPHIHDVLEEGQA